MPKQRRKQTNPDVLTELPTLEKDFQNNVIELAEWCGWDYWHFHDSRRQVAPGVYVGDKDSAGFPDLVLARTRDGKRTILFRELKKSRKARVTKDQKISLAALGGKIWAPEDWDDIVNELQ